MVTITNPNTGTVANDGTGTPLRTAIQEINANIDAISSAALYTTSNTTALNQLVVFNDTGGQNTAPSTATGYAILTAGIVTASTTIPATAITGLSPSYHQTQFEYNAKDYGVKGDTMLLSDVTTVATSATISSASYSFVAGDVGKYVRIPLGGAGSTPFAANISSISGTSAVLSLAVAESFTGNGVISFGTDDTAAINMAITTINGTGGGILAFPAGIYTVQGTGTPSDGCIQVLDNMTIVGAGMGVTTFRLIDNYAALNNIGITGIIRTPSGISNTNVKHDSFTVDGNKTNNPYNGTYNNRIIGTYCGVTPDIPCTAAITSTGGVATVTVASTSSLTSGQTVSFYNVNQSAYFGDQVITVTSGTQFTFPVSGSPTSPSTSNDNGLPFFYPTSAALATDYDIVYRGVEVVNCNYYGFDPHERTTRLVIENCISHYNGTDGMVLDYCIDAQIHNNNCSYNGRHGINGTTTSTNCQGSNNICEFNGFGALGMPGHGIVFQRGIGHIPFPTLNSFVGGSYNNNSGNGALIALADYNSIVGYTAYGNGQQNTRIFGGRYNSIVAPNGSNPSISSLGAYDEINVADHYINLTSLTQTGGIATGTFDNHNLNVGDPITIVGATQSGYNLASTPVLSVPTTSTFTYAVSSGTASPATTSSSIQLFATYYAASYNSITGIQSVSSNGNARYGLKEETSIIGSGNNSYSMISVIGAVSGIYEINNASSVISGSVGTNGISAQQARQNINVDYGINNPSTSSSTITLTNPMALTQIISMSTTGLDLVLAPMNTAQSVQKGQTIRVVNGGTNIFTVQCQDGSTNIISNLAPGKEIDIQVSSNATANGSFNLSRPFGGQKVNTTSSYTISSGDYADLVVQNNASACSLAGQALSNYAQNFYFDYFNEGAGTSTFTPGSGITVNGASTLTIPQWTGYRFSISGSNWIAK